MDGKKIVDSTLTLASIGVDLATSNYVGAALQSIGAIRDFARDAEAAKLGRWWKGVATSKVWETPQEVQGLIAAKIKENPKAKETIWAAAKAILETISDEAAEVIGSLTAEYVRDGKGPDPFFRGAVRVLADLSTEELKILREAVRLALSMQDPDRIGLSYQGSSLRASGSRGPNQPNLIEHLGEPEEIAHVVRLMTLNNLARDVFPGGSFRGPGPSDAFEVRRAQIARLGLHLGVQH